MKTKHLLFFFMLVGGIIGLLYYLLYKPNNNLIKDYRLDIMALERINDSINDLTAELLIVSDSLYNEAMNAKKDVDSIKRVSVEIEKRYKSEINRLKEKTPEQVQDRFEEIYIRDYISPAYMITTNQARMAVETYYEKVMAEELLTNAMSQITKLESLVSIKDVEIENRDMQISLLRLKTENTEAHYSQMLNDCIERNKALERRQTKGIIGFVLLLASAIGIGVAGN